MPTRNANPAAGDDGAQGISEKLPCLNSQQAKSPQAAPPAQVAVVVILARPRSAGEFDALVAGEVIATSREPFSAACRELLRRGFAPELVAILRHAGSATLSLKAPIGVAADLQVVERDQGGISFARWKAPPQYRRCAAIEFEGDLPGDYRPARENASLRVVAS
jgi:hypothetical protein